MVWAIIENIVLYYLVNQNIAGISPKYIYIFVLQSIKLQKNSIIKNYAIVKVV